MDLAAVEAVLGLVSETDLLETIERLQVRAAPRNATPGHRHVHPVCYISFM